MDKKKKKKGKEAVVEILEALSFRYTQNRFCLYGLPLRIKFYFNWSHLSLYLCIHVFVLKFVKTYNNFSS
jgi:hypothetical protein